MRVARRWRAAGDQVWGITRSRADELSKAGVEPIVVDLGGGPLPPLPEVETVFWAVGFDRHGTASPHDLHVGGLSRLLAAVSPPARIILSSSTGVWSGGQGEVVSEQTPVCPSRPSTLALIEAEQHLRSHPLGPGVALRFAGLYGPERLPRLEDVRAGREIAADPESWLNLVHLDDAASIVCWAADAAGVAPLYVVSDGRPLTRGSWYSRLAEITASPPPRFTPPEASARGGNKRADSSLLHRHRAAPLHYPDALTAIESMLTAQQPQT